MAGKTKPKPVPDLSELRVGDRLLVRHPDGREFGMSVKAFQAVYEPRGFEVVSMLDGKPVPMKAPEEPAKEPAKEPDAEGGAGDQDEGDEEE